MSIKKIIKEDLSRKDKSEIRAMINSAIDDKIKSTDMKDTIREEVINTVERLFKTLWDRRTSWRGGLR